MKFTRTINVTEGKAVYVDMATMTIQEKEFSYEGKFSNEECLKMYNKLHEVQASGVKDVKTVSGLYEWDLADIMSFAKEIDPKTRKPIEK